MSHLSPSIAYLVARSDWNTSCPGISNAWSPACDLFVTPVVNIEVNKAISSTSSRIECFRNFCITRYCRVCSSVATIISYKFNTPINNNFLSILKFITQRSNVSLASLLSWTHIESKLHAIVPNISWEISHTTWESVSINRNNLSLVMLVYSWTLPAVSHNDKIISESIQLGMFDVIWLHFHVSLRKPAVAFSIKISSVSIVSHYRLSWSCSIDNRCY